jgi:hypothetical protein
VKGTVLRYTMRELEGGDRHYVLRSYRLFLLSYIFDTLDRQISLYIIPNLRQRLRNIERLTGIESSLESRVCLLNVSAQQCMM